VRICDHDRRKFITRVGDGHPAPVRKLLADTMLNRPTR